MAAAAHLPIDVRLGQARAVDPITLLEAHDAGAVVG
jgi:hypothetical protein